MFAPEWHVETYFHRKKRYSFNVQGVCDASRRFIFASAGFPGSVGDLVAFHSTTLSKTPHKYFHRPEEYLLADKIYHLTRRCLTPYKETQASERRGGYKRFNWLHAHARVKIEHAFGVLKMRWRSLDAIPLRIRNEHEHSKALCWITAYIVLHNFLQSREDDSIW